MGPYFETYKRHFGVDDKDQKKKVLEVIMKSSFEA